MNKIPGYCIILMLVLSLALGFFGGIAADRAYINSHFEQFATAHFIKNVEIRGRILRPPHPRPRRGLDMQLEQKMLQNISDTLGLSPDQTGKVRAILESRSQEIDRVRGRLHEEIGKIFRAADADIVKILDARQKKIFEDLSAAYNDEKR